MGVGTGLYMYDVVVKSSRSLSHLLMSFLYFGLVRQQYDGCGQLAWPWKCLALALAWPWVVLKVLGLEFSGLGLMTCDLINITDELVICPRIIDVISEEAYST